MAEYIDREKACNAVYERIDELRADKEFNIVKEICISGVTKHIASIPPADVVERSKIDDIKAEIDKLTVYHTTEKGSELISKKAVYRAINFVLTGSRDIDI